MLNTFVVPEIWGQAALEKRKAHYSRLRYGQARARAKKHLKRWNQMQAMKTRLGELGVPWVPNQMFDARLAFESHLFHHAYHVARHRKGQKPEKQLEEQQGFKLTSAV